MKLGDLLRELAPDDWRPGAGPCECGHTPDQHMLGRMCLRCAVWELDHRCMEFTLPAEPNPPSQKGAPK